MRTSFILFVSAFALLSCSLIDPALPMGQPRASESGGRQDGRNDSGTTVRRDTAFLVSAVAFPKNYDWQRDSAFGSVACTLRLYRGSRVIMETQAGAAARVSIAPDRHHIVGGHLFSEYSDSRGTVVKMNGSRSWSWKERETLQGILFRDGSLYTLGRMQQGQGFTYRRDGEVLLKVDKGTLAGGFSTNCYGPGGALYEDCGHICFAYIMEMDGVQSAYLVTDGISSMLVSAPDIRILDVKSLEGRPAILYNQSGSTMVSYAGDTIGLSEDGWLRWDSGSVLLFEGRPSIIGHYLYRGEYYYAIGWRQVSYPLPGGADYIYCDGAQYLWIRRPLQQYPDCYFFHRHCAVQLGDRLAMVLTPRDMEGSPFLDTGSKTIKYKLHGYLTGVAVEITE